MKKKIKVDQLKPGMFIHDFNCGWLQHPFWGGSIKIKNEQMIQKVINSGMYELYIDTDKGLDVIDAPTEQEVNQAINTEIEKIVEPEIKDRNPVPLKEELVKAKEIKNEAKIIVKNLMQDIRLRRQIKAEQVEPVVEKMVDSIFRNKNALISLTRMKTVDEYTFLHSISVSVLMISFGNHLGFDYKIIKAIGMGGLLHDIGKMKVPIELLHKPGKLTEDEFLILREHVEHGYIILMKTPGINEISISVAAHHHERLDGTGYPNGLIGDEISIYGQMSAIVDVYDALTSVRCYQNEILPTEALRKLLEWSKFHFSNDLVQQFIRCVGIYPVGTLVRLESGLLGVVAEHNEKSSLHPVIRAVYDERKDNYISKPYDIDLSQPSNDVIADRIASHESPHKIGIIPETYL